VVLRGPLSRPNPRGTVRVTGGRVAVTEYGDWTEIALDARVTDDAVELTRAFARRGKGTVEAKGALRGIASGSAKLDGRLAARALTLTRSGMDVATLDDLDVDAQGAYAPGALDVKLTIPRGTVRLPRKAPRELQTLERRTDIVVGKKPEPKRRPALAAASTAPVALRTEGDRPFRTTIRAVAPNRLEVVSDSPEIRLALRADVTYELAGGNDYMTGVIEVVRGRVEPIGGRRFDVERGKVTFTGGPPRAAMLDVEAVYQNPVAVVTVNVTGPVSKPEVKLSSDPPLDEAQIAMLIATGRTEFKPGSGGVGTLDPGGQAGWAAAGALVDVVRNQVSELLPVDTLGLDSRAFRAGLYATDKIYIAYLRRFEARPEQGENTNEVRVEYQISPRWTFESRYGDAQSGGASLIWSRDY
jgi:translocation and assembly module TamB